MTKGRWKAPWALVLVGMVALIGTACGSEDQGADCVDDKDYFKTEVWPIMQEDCIACHSTGGQAGSTSFILQPQEQTGFIDANFATTQEVASLERDGTSYLLLKPTEGMSHEGGLRFEEGSDRFDAFSKLIKRFDNPTSCGDSDAQVDKHFAKVELITPEQTLRKASLNLAGRLPTAAEEFRVSTGGEEALDAELDRLLSEEAFFTRLEVIFNDMFLVERYLGGDNALDLLDGDYYPYARWFEQDEDDPKDFSGVNTEFLEGARRYTNNSVARMPLKLATHLVRNDKPFTEIVTADYVVVNPYAAEAYGIKDIQWVDPLDPTEWKEGKLPNANCPEGDASCANIPLAGVLTDPMWMNRFPTTPTNRNRHRSRMVYWFFLATDVMKLAERPIDPTAISGVNPTKNNPNCNSCHAVIDPVAGLMQNWNEEGSYAPPENGWYPEMFEAGYGDNKLGFEERFNAEQYLGQQIAQDRRFAVSMVHHMYRGLTGQEPLTFPTDRAAEDYNDRVIQHEIQEKVFDEIAQKFIDTNFNLKTVVKELVKSPYFRAETTKSGDEASAELGELGTGRMLTPELLSNKIEAVTGVRWVDRDGVDYLLQDDEYLILYGGIDSDDVVERITEPNGIMTGIQYRMANEIACNTTARDFTASAENRRYFPHVEMSYLPTDDAGFDVAEAQGAIRKNIQHLHWLFLGERLESNDPEIDRTYDLFVETLEEGRTKLASDELGNRLDCGATRGLDGVELPEEQQVTEDPDYTVRAWMAVVTYLLADYRFLYE